MAGDNARFRIHKNWVVKAKLRYAARDLRIRVCARISAVWDEFLNRPQLNLTCDGPATYTPSCGVTPDQQSAMSVVNRKVSALEYVGFPEVVCQVACREFRPT